MDPGCAARVGSIGLAGGLLVAERGRGESKMTPRIVACMAGQTEPPFTRIGRAAKGNRIGFEHVLSLR